MAAAASAATAVADHSDIIATAAVADHSDAESSITGDTVASNASCDEGLPASFVAAWNPFTTFGVDIWSAQSNSDPEVRRSAFSNSEPEVGNFGLFFGHWGSRANYHCRREETEVHDNADHIILKCPAQIVCLAEATLEVENALVNRSRGKC